MTAPRDEIHPPADSTPSRLFLRATATAGGATALVAAMAGLCCAGPLTVALLGIGGAVAAATLRPYRLPLLAVSLVLLLLGAAYARGYVPRRAARSVACPAATGRATRVGLWVAAVVWCIAFVLYLVS